MVNANPDDEVYHLSFYGPRLVKFVAHWPIAKRSVIEWDGKPEVVDSEELFPTEKAALLAAIGRLHKKIASDSEQTGKYFMRMNEIAEL
jgi:hypothetical protein